jgi:hypothetical protein
LRLEQVTPAVTLTTDAMSAMARCYVNY